MTSTLPSSSCHRFLAIPELVAQLAECLDDKSLHRLMLTNRSLHSFCEPTLYHSVVLGCLDRSSFERIASFDYLRALARNMHHVRSLNSGLLFAVYYFHCALLFQQQEREREREQEQRDPSNTSLSSRVLLPLPDWTPLPDTPSPQTELLLFPPMSNLTHFKMNFARLIHHRLHLNFLPSYDSRSRSLLQVVWLLNESPNLIDIEMGHIWIKAVRDIQALPLVISRLTKLRRLRLHFSLPRTEWGLLGSVLFFSCPPSLQHLRIEMIYNSGVGSDSEYYAISPTPPRRQEPLRYLQSLYIQEVLTTSMTEFLSHFKHCPTVKDIYIPKLSKLAMDISMIAQFFRQYCPKIESIVQDSYQSGSYNPLSLAIMETMTPQSLQNLKCVQYLEETDPPQDFSGLFLRHSTSLRSINLSPCWSIRSNTLRTIFCECQSLERFVLNQAESPGRCGIDLEDAVAAPWVCTNLVQLYLVVNLRDCSTPMLSSEVSAVADTTPGQRINSTENNNDLETGLMEEEWVPYYKRQGRIILNPREQEQFRLLGMFYQQLGSLVHLEYLSIIAQLDTDLTNETNQGENEEGEEGEDWSFYQRNAMPGMLNLPDTTTGRPGFLHLLSGWKNLESLVGSVALDNAETQYTVGVTDMKTMIEQWPKLSHAEFMLHGVMAWENRSEDGEKRPQLALDWLQETYPEFEIILQ